MKNVKNAFSKGEGYVRPSGAVADVDDDVGAADVDGLEVQSGP